MLVDILHKVKDVDLVVGGHKITAIKQIIGIVNKQVVKVHMITAIIGTSAERASCMVVGHVNPNKNHCQIVTVHRVTQDTHWWA